MRGMDMEPAKPEDYVSLYRQAFAEYRAFCLWNMRMLDDPPPEAALLVARALRFEGNRQARFLAERIERACHAAH